MDITGYTAYLAHTDADELLRFYRDVLDFQVREDVGRGALRWITIGAGGQPDISVLLVPADSTPGLTAEQRRSIEQMRAGGTYGWVALATRNLAAAYERLSRGGATVVQEPTTHAWGIRDFSCRDPAGNLVRVRQLG
jgi:uncharacterized glyoxalase superfamily protein PhnB